MKKNNQKKETYVAPNIKVIYTQSQYGLMQTSFPNNGGHEKVGDEGNELNAKYGWFDEEEEEEEFEN